MELHVPVFKRVQGIQSRYQRQQRQDIMEAGEVIVLVLHILLVEPQLSLLYGRERPIQSHLIEMEVVEARVVLRRHMEVKCQA